MNNLDFIIPLYFWLSSSKKGIRR